MGFDGDLYQGRPTRDGFDGAARTPRSGIYVRDISPHLASTIDYCDQFRRRHTRSLKCPPADASALLVRAASYPVPTTAEPGPFRALALPSSVRLANAALARSQAALRPLSLRRTPGLQRFCPLAYDKSTTVAPSPPCALLTSAYATIFPREPAGASQPTALGSHWRRRRISWMIGLCGRVLVSTAKSHLSRRGN